MQVTKTATLLLNLESSYTPHRKTQIITLASVSEVHSTDWKRQGGSVPRQLRVGLSGSTGCTIQYGSYIITLPGANSEHCAAAVNRHHSPCVKFLPFETDTF